VDAELIAYLDQRFAQVRADIAASAVALREQITAELRQEIAASAAELRQEIAASAAGLRQEIAASAAGLRDEIAASAAGLRSDISAETARHIGVVVEDLVAKIELVAEGVRTVDARLDRFSDEVRGEFQKVDRRLLRLHALATRGRRRRGH
jgi:DNA anti-recombination protein RmuC